jgi:hypothetical protein
VIYKTLKDAGLEQQEENSQQNEQKKQIHMSRGHGLSRGALD